MAEGEITIRVNKPVLICELCGSNKNVDYLAGGPFSRLCKNCQSIVEKVIEAYLSMIAEMPFRCIAGTIHKHCKEMG